MRPVVTLRKSAEVTWPDAGRPYFPAEPPGPRLRLTYGAAATQAELVEGVHRLAQVLAKMV